jgi:hypothetical protein
MVVLMSVSAAVPVSPLWSVFQSRVLSISVVESVAPLPVGSLSRVKRQNHNRPRRRAEQEKSLARSWRAFNEILTVGWQKRCPGSEVVYELLALCWSA